MKLMTNFKEDELMTVDLEFKNEEHICSFYGNCIMSEITLDEEK